MGYPTPDFCQFVWCFAFLTAVKRLDVGQAWAVADEQRARYHERVTRGPLRERSDVKKRKKAK